jgi:hypothetical protein
VVVEETPAFVVLAALVPDGSLDGATWRLL